MEFKVTKSIAYGCEVYCHLEMDELRRTQCLCLNCSEMGKSCETAAMLYELSCINEIALAVTRCPDFSQEV